MRQLFTLQETEKTVLPVLAQPVTETAQVAVESTTAADPKFAEQVAELSAAASHRKRAKRKWTVSGGVSLFSLASIVALLQNEVVGVKPLYMALAAIFMCGYMGSVAGLFSGMRRLNRAVSELAGTEDTAAAGALFEATTAGGSAASMAGSSLISLLPKLEPEDLMRFTDAQRHCMRAALVSISNRLNPMLFNPPLALATLAMLERCGTLDDKHAVQEVAELRTFGVVNADIKQAAVRCLAAMDMHSLGLAGTNVPWMKTKLQQRVESLSEEAVAALLEKLNRIAILRRRNLGLTAAGAVAGTITAFTSLSLGSNYPSASPVLTPIMVACLGTIFFFSASGTFALRNLTNALMLTDDLHVVPALIQAAATIDVGGSAAAMLLTRLLPMLKASDAHLLDLETRVMLNTAIARRIKDRLFVLSALKALQQVGDGSAIAIVKRLACSEERYGAGVSEAAKECLEFLEIRESQATATRTLLRASSATTVSPDSLLRPIDAPAEQRPEELLRTGVEPSQADTEAPNMSPYAAIA